MLLFTLRRLLLTLFMSRAVVWNAFYTLPLSSYGGLGFNVLQDLDRFTMWKISFFFFVIIAIPLHNNRTLASINLFTEHSD
uniref:Uncharacterized protein n=1 Tax=Anguilla anguilla TaxID=7936 RepID=A0A0E9X5X3_ANGAN